MYKYVYVGSTPVSMKDLGIIEPNSVVNSKNKISHPKFEEAKIKEKTTNKKKRK